PLWLQDDVTVLALRRAPQAASATAAGSPRTERSAMARVEAPQAEREAGAPLPRELEAARADRLDLDDVDDAVPAGNPRLLGFLPARTQRQALTAGSIFGLVLHIMLVTLVTMGVLVASASGVRENEARDQQVLLGTVRAGLLEQQVGIDGYASSADPGLLAPYDAGRGDEDAALARLRRESAGKPWAGPVQEGAGANGS